MAPPSTFPPLASNELALAVPAAHPTSPGHTLLTLRRAGSSNVSRSALLTGIGWNLRVERGVDPLAYACVRGAVDALWASARELTPQWLEDYAQRVREAPRLLPAAEAEDDALQPPPAPHDFQLAALDRLAQARLRAARASRSSARDRMTPALLLKSLPMLGCSTCRPRSVPPG